MPDIPLWLMVVAFVIVLGPLVFLHELGHFLVAKWNHIQVEEFGFGYPPRLLTLFERGGTKYTLNLLPLGGFVRPAGEDDPNYPGGLAGSPKRVRIAVLVAGAGMNLLTAFVIFSIGFAIGWPDRVQVAEVTPGSPAAQVGLQRNDVILRANGIEMHSLTEFRDYTYAHLGEPIRLDIERGSQTLSLTVTPRVNPPAGQGAVGISMAPLLVQYGPIAAIGRGGSETVNSILAIVQLPGRVIRGQIPAADARPVGPVGISQIGGATILASIDSNTLFPILSLIAEISLALAITNLLPLPALDGGRILFVLIEAIRGKRVSPERETVVHFVGMMLLIVLMLLITYQDLVNPILGRQ